MPDKETWLRIALLTFFAILLAVVLLPYFRNGTLISGGEGAYFLDYLTLFKNYAYSWVNWGTGSFALSINFGFPFHMLLAQIVISNERTLSFLLIYSIFFLPFISIYLLLLKLKVKTYLAFLLSIFYVLNPFSFIFLQAINQWNVIALYLLPAFLYLILRFYDDDLKLFLFFGLHSLVFAFANANAPTMVMYQVILVILTFFASLYREKNEWKIVNFIRKYSIVFGSFLLFNFWWIFNWFYIYRSAEAAYSTKFAISWLNGIAGEIPAVARSLSLANLTGFPPSSTYGFLSSYFNYFFTPLILVIPFMVIILAFKNIKKLKSDLIFLSLSFIILIFLSKGISGIFGGIYEYLVLHIPVFSIFKSANEKWGIPLVLFTTILLAYSISSFKILIEKRLVYFLLVIYIVYISFPFFSGNLIPDYQRDKSFTGTRAFYNKPEYINLRQTLNRDPFVYRVLSLPGGGNYQVALKQDNGKYYTGNDPVLSNSTKSFLAPYNGSLTQHFPILFKSIADKNYLRLFGIFNIGKIVINKDEYPWFGFSARQNIDEIEKILDSQLMSEKGKSIDVYDTSAYVYPHIYIPEEIISTTSALPEALNIIATINDQKKSPIGIFFNDKAKGLDLARRGEPPKISFSQINESKYVVDVRGAKAPYVLVLSGTYHPGWKVYLRKKQDTVVGQINKQYFNGKVTENYRHFSALDKNYSETWSLSSISDSRHLEINGYANAWLIDPKDVNNLSDYQLIIEFWPQRLFYIGVYIALLSALVPLVAILIRFIVKIFKKK